MERGGPITRAGPQILGPTCAWASTHRPSRNWIHYADGKHFASGDDKPTCCLLTFNTKFNYQSTLLLVKDNNVSMFKIRNISKKSKQPGLDLTNMIV